jgi:hypothetical protein
MKKIICILLFISISIPFWGQKLGIQAGYSLTNTFASIDKSSLSFNRKPVSGFTVGPIFSWDFLNNNDLGRSFGADIALMFNMRNANFVITYKEYTPIAFKQNLYYLDIPLHAYYKQKIKNTTLIMFLGPSFNIGLDGSNYAQENTAMQKPIFNSKIDQKELFGKDNTYKRLEIGIDLGIAAEYKNILFKASYMQGVNNVTQNAATPYGIEEIGSGIKQTYMHGVFSFCIGYTFDLKGPKEKTYSK